MTDTPRSNVQVSIETMMIRTAILADSRQALADGACNGWRRRTVEGAYAKNRPRIPQ